MRNPSGKFNKTYRFLIVLVIMIYFDKNLIYPEVQEYWSNKDHPHMLRIYLICLTPNNISNTAANIQVLFTSFSFYIISNWKSQLSLIKKNWSYDTITLPQRVFTMRLNFYFKNFIISRKIRCCFLCI